ncbi:MAG TPA: STAS domain-containing protein [Candidatus Tumulicola sp.]|nr:STAS domain-containing protein [Candidatus Tumulicola sp.]
MPHSNPTVVRLEDREWDIASADVLAKLLESTYEQPEVVVDLSAVHYIDSTCLGKLARMRGERIRRGLHPGRLVIATPQVRRIFHIVQYDLIFEVFDSVEAAIAEGNGESAPQEARPSP